VLQNLNQLRGGHPSTTWTWFGERMFNMEGTYYIKVECVYIPHAWVSKFPNE
jgi:hypothetical protein